MLVKYFCLRRQDKEKIQRVCSIIHRVECFLLKFNPIITKAQINGKRYPKKKCMNTMQSETILPGSSSEDDDCRYYRAQFDDQFIISKWSFDTQKEKEKNKFINQFKKWGAVFQHILRQKCNLFRYFCFFLLKAVQSFYPFDSCRIQV